MYSSEELFMNKFIACLKEMHVNAIPFDNDDFYQGVEKMREYYSKNQQSFGEYKDELSMLFIQRPFDGLFSEFRRAISKQNGWYLSFINPDYVIADIKISNKDAEYTLNQEDLAINTKFIFDYAKAFCDGAQVKTMSYLKVRG